MAAYRARPQAASLTARAEGPQGMLTTVRLYVLHDLDFAYSIQPTNVREETHNKRVFVLSKASAKHFNELHILIHNSGSPRLC